MQDQTTFGIKEIADRMRFRKENNHSTVLLLGAQAGALFRSEHFRRHLRDFTHPDISMLSYASQFSHHFTTLLGSRFSETEVHSLFRTSFQSCESSKADICLANLVKQEYFDDIISTSIDDVLESSLREVELKEQKDFEVFLSYRSFSPEKTTPTRIIKVFGDFLKRNYDLKRYLNPSDDEHYTALQHILARDLLIIGADLEWDRHILNAIPGEGASGMVWVVSEDDPSHDETIASLLRQRPSQSITIGRNGRFENFLRLLHEHLSDGALLNYQFVHEVKNQLIEISSQLGDISHRIQPLQENYRHVIDELLQIQEKLGRLLQNQPDLQ